MHTLSDRDHATRGDPFWRKAAFAGLRSRYNFAMESSGRHQCLIYEGAPSNHLPAVAAILLDRLKRNHRCVYLNSPTMIVGIHSHLAAAGLDVERELNEANLVLASDRPHLAGGRFDVESMIQSLKDTLNRAIRDGYVGLFATGDMSWELGMETESANLLEYEWRLEELFHERQELSGICQYHVGSLPSEMMRHSLLAHPSIFISEKRSLTNPHYVGSKSLASQSAANAVIDIAIHQLCQSGTTSA
jgi:MEDS: MEthanogen/methylotroph, DcmR Sensory domain